MRRRQEAAGLMLLLVVLAVCSFAQAMDIYRQRVRPSEEQRKQEALDKLMEVLGIQTGLADEESATPPQYMTELYNTVTDADGHTTASNPYDAKVVRCCTEKAAVNSSAQLYLFNLAGLKNNESLIEAELHLFRRRSLRALVHPSVLSSPYYIIRVYQVLPEKSLDEPDLHRLLNVHYVGAYSSGWQVFNVKQAVISWLTEESPNLGLLVAATTIFGDRVPVEFARNETDAQSKKPILVLFNDDESNVGPIQASYLHEQQPEDEEPSAGGKRSKRHWTGQPEVSGYVEPGLPARFHREKKHRSTDRHRKTHGFVPKQRSLEQTLSSMDIYERAMLRERLEAQREEEANKGPRQKRETEPTSQAAAATECHPPEPEPCARRELYVNFRDIGMTSIIAPDGYAAYQCRGHCKSPLSQDQKPTNHATIQGIIHKMKLATDQDVREPCCVPVSLSSISMLYHDDERDQVVLKSYTDMAVVSCGCR